MSGFHFARFDSVRPEPVGLVSFHSVITSQPALSYSSVISTISLSAVTTGELAGSTFITWTGQFSSDAGQSLLAFTWPMKTAQAHRLPAPYFTDAGVVEDAKFRREEALADLAKSIKA